MLNEIYNKVLDLCFTTAKDLFTQLKCATVGGYCEKFISPQPNVYILKLTATKRKG